jgi:hypothetical protein
MGKASRKYLAFCNIGQVIEDQLCLVKEFMVHSFAG